MEMIGNRGKGETVFFGGASEADEITRGKFFAGEVVTDLDLAMVGHDSLSLLASDDGDRDWDGHKVAPKQIPLSSDSVRFTARF